MEWQEYKASLCSGCGNPRHESFAPENELRYDAEALKCHACGARDHEGKRFRDAEHSDSSGIYIVPFERE